MDIASSNFHEESAIFGGSSNFQQGVLNVLRQYQPQLIGAATTCLAETIGEDMPRLLLDLKEKHGDRITAPIVTVSTASYRGTHMDGFHAAVKAVVAKLADGQNKSIRVNLLPGFVSPADIRHLQEICLDFGLEASILPDYSETLDGGSWDEYHRLQEGGTPLEAIRKMGGAVGTLELCRFVEEEYSAGAWLLKTCGVPRDNIGLPTGVTASDEFFKLVGLYSGRAVPPKYIKERGRLLDSYVDAHKYVFGKKALIYGDADFVVKVIDVYPPTYADQPELAADHGLDGPLGGR